MRATSKPLPVALERCAPSLAPDSARPSRYPGVAERRASKRGNALSVHTFGMHRWRVAVGYAAWPCRLPIRYKSLSRSDPSSNIDQESVGPFAPEPPTPGIDDCYFYHSMDIPGYGHVTGEWDFRGHEAEYLGGVPLQGKRVLELGTASGYLCTFMESKGASVIAHDLSPDQSWDIVPYASRDVVDLISDRKQHIAAINAGWWLNWKARGLTARMVYGSIYQLPGAIGEVDVATYGSILLHLRDPFLALWNGARLTKSTVIVTDTFPRRLLPVRAALSRFPVTIFGPGGRSGSHETWWWLSPRTIQRMLSVLGFEESAVSYHHQLHRGRNRKLFTVVAHRTAGQPDMSPVP
jgi:hypothetical protein